MPASAVCHQPASSRKGQQERIHLARQRVSSNPVDRNESTGDEAIGCCPKALRPHDAQSISAQVNSINASKEEERERRVCGNAEAGGSDSQAPRPPLNS